MTESELMKDFDGEKHGKRYCNKMGCSNCNGTDENGEPNGYGCTGQEEYEQKLYNAILKRRLKKQPQAQIQNRSQAQSRKESA